MRKVFFALWLMAVPEVGFAQSSSDSAAAIAQAQADLQHLQGEIPLAMAEVRRLTDKAAIDKATLEAHVEGLHNVPPAAMTQPMAPPPAVVGGK
jgi:hypothetical protein